MFNLKGWLRGLKGKRCSPVRKHQRSGRLVVEQLEDRTVPCHAQLNALPVVIENPGGNTTLHVTGDVYDLDGTCSFNLIAEASGHGAGYAVPGVDFVAVNERITVTNNNASKPVAFSADITIKDDGADDGTEQFQVRLDNPSGCTISQPNPEVATILEEPRINSYSTTIAEGGTVNGSVSFSAPPGTYAATVNFHDGTGNLPATVDLQHKTVSFTHTFGEEGNYAGTITLTKTDTPQISVSNTLTVNVTEAPWTITTFANQQIDVGQTLSGLNGKVNDVAVDLPAHVYVSFGDGTATQEVDTNASGQYTLPAHQYGSAGTYTVTVDAYNQDGDSTKETCFEVDVIAKPTVKFNGDAGTAAGAQGVEGSPTTVTGTFTVDPRAEHVSLTVNYHDGTGEHRLGYNATNDTFSITLPAGEEGDYPLTVTVHADDQSAGANTTVHVKEAEWTISTFANQQVDLGQTLPGLAGKVNDVAVDLPAHVYVNFGDGTATQEVDTNASGQYTLPAHQYGSAGTYKVTVDVYNKDCDSTEETCFRVDVIAKPTVKFNGDAGTAAGARGVEGSPTTVTGSFTVDHLARNVSLTVNFHDGTGEHTLSYNPANDTFSITLPAGEEGDYPLTVSVHADDQSASADTTVHVEEAPWTISGFSHYEFYAGQALQPLSGQVYDVAVDLPAHVYVNFGDGSATQELDTDASGQYTLPLHTYTLAGTYTVNVDVFNDDCDSEKQTSFKVDVLAKPTVKFDGDAGTAVGAQGVEGTPTTVTGSFTVDPQVESVSLTVNYRDGTGEHPLSYNSANNTFSITLPAGEEGDYPLTVTVHADGLSASADTTVHVQEAAWTISKFSNQQLDLGQTLPGLNGQVNDVSVDLPAHVYVNFGDGSATQEVDTNASGQYTLPTHLYGSAGTYTVKVDVFNADCDSEKQTCFQVDVIANPTVTFNGDAGTKAGAQGLEGSPTTVTGSFTVDPRAESVCLTVNYHDGTGDHPLSYNPANDTFSITLPAGEEGDYPLTVTVHADDQSASADATVHVKEAPWTISKFSNQQLDLGQTLPGLNGLVNDVSVDLPAHVYVNFGDGSATQEVDTNASGQYTLPAHLYGSAGTYTVKVDVFNADCDSEKQTCFKVDVIANPTVTFNGDAGTEAGAQGLEGSPTTVTGSFTVDPRAENVCLTVNYHDGTGDHPLSYNPANDTFSITLPAGEEGDYPLTVTVHADDQSASADTTVHVEEAPWTISTFRNQQLDLGQTLPGLNGKVNDVSVDLPAHVYVNFGDGSATQEVDTNASGQYTLPSHVYANAGTYTVKVDVFNADCDSEKQTCFKVDVIANPTVTFNGDAGTEAGAQGLEGSPTTVTGSFTVDPRAENVCLTVNYHDGTGEHRLSYDPSNNTFSITLPAGEEGDYPLTVTVHADDQSAGADTTVHVQEAAWTISKFSNQQLDLGQTLPGLNGKVNDVSVDLPAHVYVNFGDGSATQEVDTNASGQYTLPAHLYGSAGTYTVKVDVLNADCDSEKQTCFQVDVIANPTVTFNGDAGTAAGAQGTEGSPTTVTGSFTVDPRAENVCLTVNYHDGTGEHPLSYNAANDTFSITLPAGEEGDYPLTVTVHADDQSASADTTVHVQEAAWTISKFSNQQLDLGQTLPGLNGKVNDVSVDLPAHVYVNFGDGSATQEVDTNASGQYTLPAHLYGSAGTYTVKVDVFNADCDSEKQTCFKVDVIANPTVTFNGDAGTKAGAQGVEGTPTTVTGSFTVDPRAENVCLTVNYHDGTGEHRLSYDPSNNTFSITLPAGEEGDYPLTVTVRADDQSASADTTVHVQEAAWTISKFSNQQLDLGQTLPGLNGKVNDVSVDLPAHAYVNFGDGSATQEVDTNASGQYTLPAHVYAAAGTYNVQVVVDNADSDSEKQTCFKVDVIANPTVTFNGDAGTAAGAQGTEGSPTTVTGSFTVDPRAENVCLTVNYHDGTGEHPLAYNPANDTFSITLPAGEEGDYPLTVTVHADDQSASADTTVHVEEAPWTITTFSNQELTLGQSLSGLSGKVNDVSVDLPAHVYVNFGDGTPVVSVQTDNNGNYVLPNHTYGASGQFNVTITVFNQDGDSSKTTGFEVTVSKAPTTPYLPPNSLIITILIGNQPHQPFFCWPGQVHTPPVCPITTFYIQPAAQLYQSGPSGWDNHPPEVYFDFQDGQDHTVVEIDEGEQLHQKGHLYDMDGDPLIGFYKIDDEAGWRALPLQGDNRSFTLDLDLPVGEHRITVKAIDPYGAEGWKTLRVIVKEVSLSCDVNPETKLATGAEYQPTGVANYTGHRKLTGTIDYGDGTTVELKDVPANKQFKLPVHKYAKPGVYKVKLTVTDGRKTATSTLKKVEVQDAPVGAAFPVDDDGLVEFTSASAFNLNGVLGEDGDDMQLFYAALAGIALTGPVLTVADRYFAAVGEGKEELKDPRLKLPEVL